MSAVMTTASRVITVATIGGSLTALVFGQLVTAGALAFCTLVLWSAATRPLVRREEPTTRAPRYSEDHLSDSYQIGYDTGYELGYETARRRAHQEGNT